MYDKMEDIFRTYGAGIMSSVLIFLVLIAVLDYSGLFMTIRIMIYRKPVGRLRVAYLFATGPYKDCGPLFGRVTQMAPNNRCLGVYFDDPATTPESKLRYIAGTVLSEDDALESDDEALEARLVDDGFRVVEFPAMRRAVGTEFPFPWFMSILIAVQRVYPKLKRVIEKERLIARPCMELYDGPKIHFYMPLTDQEEFYVPEAHQS